MARRLRRPISVLWVGLFAVFPAAAQEPPVPSSSVSALPQDPFDQWLDEVRAQRQVREELRRAAKEARDARRRWIDPWGAAQQEAREQETQRRREAFMDKIERDRETLRNQGPWALQQGPWQDETTSPLAPTQSPPPPGTDSTAMSGQGIPSTSPYPLPGWDNRWYYRGF